MALPLCLRYALSVGLVSLVSACAASEDFDSGPGNDARADAGTAADVRADLGTQSDVPRTDVPRSDVPSTDVARDVPGSDVPRTDVPRVDTFVPPPDTGGRCVDSCTDNSQCQSSCPAPSSGHSQCCAFNTCTEVAQPTCPSSTTDGGTTGSDSGFPGFDAGGGFECFMTMRTCTSAADCAACGTGWQCLGFGTRYCVPPF